MREVVTSAPGKLYLFGEHGVMWGAGSIATAIDYRIAARVRARDDDYVEIFSEGVEPPIRGLRIQIGNLKTLDLKKEEDVPKGADYLVSALQQYHETYGLRHGVDVYIESKIPKVARSFGSSSSLVVAAQKGLSEIFDRKLTEQELFDIGYQAHTIKVQEGAGSGFDIACGVLGGTIYFKKAGTVREKLQISDLPLSYASIIEAKKYVTPQMVRKVREKVEGDPQFYHDTIFSPMQAIVEEAKSLITNHNKARLGELMTQNHFLLASLLGSVGESAELANKVVDEAKKGGAYGAKMTGGGPDNVIALVDPDKKKSVEEAMQLAGGNVVQIVPNCEGVKIESSS